jgi:UDP-N-acetylglucosamine acyltransferase
MPPTTTTTRTDVTIHPTALVDPLATIDPTAEIGPYVVIEGPVEIGPRTRLMAHAVVLGRTVVGADNVIHAGAVLGDTPQDVKYAGAPTGLRIGDRNVIREHAVLQRATSAETWTIVGDENYFMTNAHVAHNCTVGTHVTVASGALLAGHVTVGDQAFVSGNCVVHQFTRIGRLAIMRGLARASRDIPPFAIADGTHEIRGVNRVGLRRAGFDTAAIRTLVRAFRTLFRVRRNLSEAMTQVEAECRSPEVDELLAFIRSAKRGVAMGPPRAMAARSDDE